MAPLAPIDVQTTVKYLCKGSKNQRYFSKGIEVNIGEYEDKAVLMRDARPTRDQFTLETAGFELLDHESSVTDWYDRKQLNNLYINEIIALVKEATGADKVAVFSPPTLRKNTEDPGSVYQPRALDVHTDWSPANAEWAGENRTELGAEGYSRFVFVNVWRAFTPPPQDWPLAMVDARTVSNDEGEPYPMIIVDKIPEKLPMDPVPPTTIEGANFVYRDSHEWRYFSNMTKNEALAFKLYDSDWKKGMKAWRCPHTAFFDGREGTIPRESVEVRTICYFK